MVDLPAVMLFVSSIFGSRRHTISLFNAAWDGRVKDVWWALEVGYDVNAVEEEVGGTALMYAAGNGHVAATRMLLSVEGIDVNQQFTGHERGVALLYAVRHGCYKTVRLLLAAPGIRVNAFNSFADTPLNTAQRHRRMDIVDLLRRCGAY